MKFPLWTKGALVLTAAFALFSVGCGSQPEAKKEEPKPAAKPAPSVPDVKVIQAIIDLATAGKPGPNAKKVAPAPEVIGKGKTSITVKAKGGGVPYSFWTDSIDVTGSGNVVEADVAWNNKDKVLLIGKDRTFTCKNGGTADGAFLMVVYGKDNTLKKPTGAGFWVADLDAGECAVEAAGLYGCKFDPTGAMSDCGGAAIQEVPVIDVVITPLPASSAPAAPPAKQ
jgi:hypothetical protein